MSEELLKLEEDLEKLAAETSIRIDPCSRCHGDANHKMNDGSIFVCPNCKGNGYASEKNFYIISNAIKTAAHRNTYDYFYHAKKAVLQKLIGYAATKPSFSVSLKELHWFDGPFSDFWHHK